MSIEFKSHIFAATFPIRALNSNVVHQDRVFVPPYAAARIQTHVSTVAPNQRDLLKDALPTELPRRGNIKEHYSELRAPQSSFLVK